MFHPFCNNKRVYIELTVVRSFIYYAQVDAYGRRRNWIEVSVSLKLPAFHTYEQRSVNVKLILIMPLYTKCRGYSRNYVLKGNDNDTMIVCHVKWVTTTHRITFETIHTKVNLTTIRVLLLKFNVASCVGKTIKQNRNLKSNYAVAMVDAQS